MVTLTTHKRIRQQMEEKKRKALEELDQGQDSGEAAPGIPDLDLGAMTVPKLRELAADNGIDLAGLTLKQEIIDRILTAKTGADANAALDEDVGGDNSAGDNPEAQGEGQTPSEGEVNQDGADPSNAPTNPDTGSA